MRDPLVGVLVTLGGLVLVFLVVLGAVATYDAMADDDMMDGMWDMGGTMDHMSGMMGGGSD